MIDRWLKQHGAGEKQLASVCAAFFTDQGKRIIADLADAGFEPDANVLDVEAETERFLAAISEPMLTFMATGAQDVFRQRKKSAKAFDFEKFNLPEATKQAIELAFGELQKQDFWREIQEATGTLITKVLTQSIAEGQTIDEMRKRLEQTFAGMSRVRAESIARTETTLGYSMGHQASYEGLAADGILSEKEWLAVVDDDTRQTHADADGQKVAVNESFSIGSASAPYPGAATLPARERIRCRCTTAGVF